MRATAASILLFIINLVGLGAGPLIAAAFFWTARKTIKEDLVS
ncbi:hypothetical protein [Phenylobacterium sp.]|nr:hypothetical protein [Phenylobacterium sp.]